LVSTSVYPMYYSTICNFAVSRILDFSSVLVTLTVSA
jgi:hypothetical protein